MQFNVRIKVTPNLRGPTFTNFFLFNQIKVIIQGNISEKMKIKSLFKQNMQGGGDGLGENYHLYFYLKLDCDEYINKSLFDMEIC